MTVVKDLSLHYATEDLESLKQDVAEIQKLIATAEQNPETMPLMVKAIYTIIVLAVDRMVDKSVDRSMELDEEGASIQ